ncbi:MAG TPA: hypothetical protein VIC52_00730 [Actinomycetota bacterium]|jgi:hypothetical protein
MTDGATEQTRISLTRTDVENVLSRFRVHLTDPDGSSTEHEVTVSRAEWERFGAGYRTPEELVEASFRFLLERESKDRILGSFGLGQIGTYFPSYGRDIDPTA